MSDLHVFPIKSQSWKKALDEMRRDGHRAYYPRDCSRERRPGVYKGYALGTGRPADAIYVRASIGVVEHGVARQMLLTGRVRSRSPRVENPFKPGDKVLFSLLRADVQATVTETRSRTCRIAYDMLGKTHTQAINYTQLRPG